METPTFMMTEDARMVYSLLLIAKHIIQFNKDIIFVFCFVSNQFRLSR